MVPTCSDQQAACNRSLCRKHSTCNRSEGRGEPETVYLRERELLQVQLGCLLEVGYGLLNRFSLADGAHLRAFRDAHLLLTMENDGQSMHSPIRVSPRPCPRSPVSKSRS